MCRNDTDLQGRSCASAADIDAAMALLSECRRAEQLDFWPPICMLRAELSDPVAAADDARLWCDAEGRPVAFAMLREGWTLISSIQPGRRSHVLECHMLNWAAERAAQIAWNCGERVALCVPLRNDDRAGAAFLRRQGFRLEELRMHYLMCPLDKPIAAPQLPPGFQLRPLDGEPEAVPQLELHRQIFPGATLQFGERLQLMRSPGYRPELDLVIAGSDNSLLAFCRASICAEENAHFAHSIGWIEMLGVHPQYRRRGLGRALLLAAQQRLRAAGIEQAWLRTCSPNEAMRRLAGSCGFHTTYQICWYVADEYTLEELFAQLASQPV